MASPFFFVESITAGGSVLVLPEETSKHVIQVLRMKEGDTLHLTDGLGQVADVVITDPHKKRCTVTIARTIQVERQDKQHTIAISLLKNNTRFEWFLEKATEIGVARVVPLICTRTEKQKFRFKRMQAILKSAMIQSQQAWLPQLEEPVLFKSFVDNVTDENLYIAHCESWKDRNPLAKHVLASSTILIGPEGDFSSEEIESAMARNFQPVSLGNTRLRTETAGIVAATLLCREA
jgi:16S rRNA (uracil1498-N3)-methyltransferase